MRTRRQALGQHFLHNNAVIQKILTLVETEITEAHPTPKALLEIGPGKLALTMGLAEIAKRKNIPLILVERDKLLEDEIRTTLALSAARADLSANKSGNEHANISNDTTHNESYNESHDTLHFMDAATEKLPALFNDMETQNRTPIFIASNLPYSASSQILANICHQLKNIAGCVVMVQKELALRMTAPAKNRERGAFSLLIQSYFNVQQEFDVPPGAFSPPPKVMSTVVSMTPHVHPLIEGLKSPLEFERFCTKLFSGRRKMIRNLIPTEMHEHFPKLSISGTERPETLELETVLKLYRLSGVGELN